ncbi:helix-turn-helix domain-containing protein [Rhodobacteraceae bacterium M385]|nr:helix-turn-helix domain-containing protein [Rhodobacteraceae bacterium M385]
MTGLMNIQSDRLKAIRKGRNIGRVKLANLSGLTERKLTRIEAQTTVVLPRSMFAKLSEVLQVPEPTLAGDFPMTYADLRPLAK